jgi:hypothetical protein
LEQKEAKPRENDSLSYAHNFKKTEQKDCVARRPAMLAMFDECLSVFVAYKNVFAGSGSGSDSRDDRRLPRRG